jgi:hypothetical protein
LGLLSSSFQELYLGSEAIEPFYAVAISFWLALSVMAIIGIIYPVKMLPLLLLQLLYKSFWLTAVGIPLWSLGNLGNAEELFMANAIGVVLDVLVIPWVFVAKKYFTKPIW